MNRESFKYLVALSGGADSVALLCGLHSLGYQIEAVHCNFHLRGDESDRDERFCQALCKKLNVPFHIAHFDTLTYAQLHKISIEMAARELRYRYFEQLRQDIGAAAVCVAHHRDDNAETVLLNLIRGTGISGLAGIAPQRDHIIRPLLNVSRAEIRAYLSAIGQDFVTDSTNLIDNAVRNKIRLNIIPLLAEINPSVSESIAKTAERMREAEKIIDHSLTEVAQHICEPRERGFAVSIAKLQNTVSPEYTLYHILNKYGFRPAQIEQMAGNLDAETGREWCSDTYAALIDRGFLLVEPIAPAPARPMTIPEDGTYGYADEIRFRFSSMAISTDFRPSRSLDEVTLDASHIRFPLIIRRVQSGDRFIPFGMHGSKLVSDFLTDSKLSLFEKRRQLVITDSSDQILWLVRLRPAEPYRVTSATKKVLIIKILG